jgi:hypothetical protein
MSSLAIWFLKRGYLVSLQVIIGDFQQEIKVKMEARYARNHRIRSTLRVECEKVGRIHLYLRR